jgi:hypothetical protein
MKIIMWSAWLSLLDPSAEMRFDQRVWKGTFEECQISAQQQMKNARGGKKLVTCWRTVKR